MTVNDPLLKKLKGYILTFCLEDKQPIKDDHPKLQEFCETLEAILRKGLEDTMSLFGNVRRDYWSWIYLLFQRKPQNRPLPTFTMAVEAVTNSPKVTTLQGRGRLFLREVLNRKALLPTLQMLLEHVKIIETFYDPQCSIIGNEILFEIFLSLVHQIQQIDFNLKCKNAVFLDGTWTLPVYKELELVPCVKLGMRIHLARGFPFVIYIAPGGVVEDCGEIEVGDIIDEVMHTPTRNMRLSQLSGIKQANNSKPFHMCIIKTKLMDATCFPGLHHILPVQSKDYMERLRKRLREVADEHERNGPAAGDFALTPTHALLPEEQDEQLPAFHSEDKAKYDVYYVAKLDTGKCGRVEHVEKTIQQALCDKKPEENLQELQQCVLELTETGVNIKDKSTDQEVLSHCYTTISACGRRLDYRLYFCFFVGDTSVALAENFTAYVFRATSDEDCRIILCATAQGFDRTHWCV